MLAETTVMASSSSGFFGAVALLNKFPVLIRATTDDYEPIPGYAYGEIIKISYETETICEQLHAYFIDRLEKDSGFVKLKVLKLLRHLIQNGSSLFRKILRKQYKQIIACTNTSGPADSQYGLTVYKAVRSEAKEVLQILFDSQSIEGDVEDDGRLRSPGKFMSGMGPSMQSGKYDGFGFSSPLPEKTVTEKVVNSLSEFVGKLMNRPDNDAEMFRKSLEVDRGPYRAVSFDVVPETLCNDANENSTGPQQSATNDDNTSTISFDSLENSVIGADDLAERQFVDDLSHLSCDANGLLGRNQLASARHRYCLLRGCVILAILKEKCCTENEVGIRMKTLQLIEECLHHGDVGARDVRQLLRETFVDMPETSAVSLKARKLLHIADWKLLNA